MRQSRGQNVLVYPDHEHLTHVYEAPEVRQFLRMAFEEYPPLFYYLAPDATFGVLTQFYFAFADEDELIRDGERFGTNISPRLVEELARALAQGAARATRLGEDPKQFIEEWLPQVPEAIREVVFMAALRVAEELGQV